MSIKDTLKPSGSPLVIDLVKAAGVDVSPWYQSKAGKVESPNTNPAYCYEWAFRQPDKLVILNVWHREISEDSGQVWCDINPREWSDSARQETKLTPSQRGAISKRANRMDHEIAYASDNHLPIRLIVGDGVLRDRSDSKSNKASRMTLRLLDPEPWSVLRYNKETGNCRLVRGAITRYVDQYMAPDPRLRNRFEVTSQGYERDRKVRDAALVRAGGKCEFCDEPGFLMEDDRTYLETHHVVPLSEDGEDHERNVAAICPNDHREAHHGKRRDSIRASLLAMLAAKYGN